MGNTTKTTTGVPDWLEDPTKKSLKDIEDWLGSKDNYIYGSRDGESLWTEMSKLQTDAIGNVAWLANQDLGKMFHLDQAKGMWDQYAKAGPNTISGDYSGGKMAAPKNISTERLVDENGWLGSIDSYMNPYTDRVLSPVIRELQQEDQRQKNRIGGMAQMSGAFGDARHGIMEGEQSSRTNEAVGDATNRVYSDAYNTAMGQRASDIGRRDTMETGNTNRALEAAMTNLNSYNAGQDRKLNADQFNSRAKDIATDRLGTAATGIVGIGDNLYNKFTDINDALYNAGTVVRDNEEKRRKTQEDFIKAINSKKYDDALDLLAALNGTSNYTKTSSEKQSNDTDLWKVISSGLGGFF
ncbi:MAG TPA: hypothetical protein VGN93_13315 [Shinella sp.]|jgi:hypothetical protein|uniref:hypothetical protein n=1 Tax=Shinella sp. TaxID=1870904 RepID=UPI002E14806C|nr:hypothetical protein [Shinella sp.]